MKLYLASLTPQIRTLCEEVFREIPKQEWTLYIASNESAATLDADLYLWDIEHAMPPFNAIAPRDTWRHFFLVDRTRLQQVRELIPFEGPQILLKPVTKAALTVFLTDACKRCSRHSPTTDVLIEGLQADRDELLQCLMQANLKLQEYDHDRTNFLARAIHDFRAPLTAVTGYCGLLLCEDVGTLTEDQRGVLERMHHSAKKLSRMVSAMFQLSIAPHIEAGVSLQSGEIRDCVDHALNEVLPAADEKRLTITVDAAPAPEALYFEQGKLEQVLLNLLDNACKFTPRGGTIEIRGYPYYWEDRPGMEADMASADDSGRRIRKPANSYRLDIRDTGPGIPPVHLTKVFEEYTSYGGGVDRSGGGLGLAICRMIVNQHKGHIWAENSKNGGVFSFVLPFHSGSSAIDQPGSKTIHAGASL